MPIPYFGKTTEFPSVKNASFLSRAHSFVCSLNPFQRTNRNIAVSFVAATNEHRKAQSKVIAPGDNLLHRSKFGLPATPNKPQFNFPPGSVDLNSDDSSTDASFYLGVFKNEVKTRQVQRFADEFSSDDSSADASRYLKRYGNQGGACQHPKIVDRVPLAFQNSRQDIILDLKEKIIGANLHNTEFFNTQNLTSLDKLLEVLGNFVSDKNLSKLDNLTPAEANTVFVNFCETSKARQSKEGFSAR